MLVEKEKEKEEESFFDGQAPFFIHWQRMVDWVGKDAEGTSLLWGNGPEVYFASRNPRGGSGSSSPARLCPKRSTNTIRGTRTLWRNQL